MKKEDGMDYLTKCANREYLEAFVEEYTKKENKSGFFVLIDVDYLKRANDLVGHAFGDSLLAEIAENIQSVFRKDDIVARIGGDEFAVFILGSPSDTAIGKRLHQLLKKCQKTVTVDHTITFMVSLSVGISCFPKDANTFEGLYRKADQALYCSKEYGRNRYTFYDHMQVQDGMATEFETEEPVFEEEPDSNCRNLLDSLQNVGVYVITEKEHRILFYNRKLEEITPGVKVGMICNELWLGACAKCPLDSIGEKSSERIIDYNSPFGEVVEISATRVLWNHKIPAFVIRIYPHIDNPDMINKKEIVIGGNLVCTYVIDQDYHLNSYSYNAKNIFPQIQLGQKCHESFFGRSVPCANCPRNAAEFQSMAEVKNGQLYVSKASACCLSDGSTAYMISMYDSLQKHGKNAVSNQLVSASEVHLRDALTGGYNRQGYKDALERLKRSGEDLSEYAILFVNIKGFKAINKMFGDEAGDSLLRNLYMRIYTSSLKPKVAARKESDHFIFLVEKRFLNLNLLEEILKYRWKYNGQENFIHCRCGIYYIDNPEEPIQNMIDYARIANEHIKDGYSRFYYVYKDAMGEDYLEQSEILAFYEIAFQKQEFYVVYQPVVDAKTGKIVSSEALIRWKSAEKGMISPGTFIPTLERYGHIAKLDAFVMRKVENFLSDRMDKGLPVVPVSVNLSRMDFMDGDAAMRMLERMEKGSTLSEYIRYEITETAYADFENHQSEFLSKMRLGGRKILMDDFGKGYSSFGAIQKFEFDILKIDMCFVQQIETNAKIKSVIGAIIGMCHDLDIRVVAEGVETKGQADFLREKGCDYLQGYYFSKPLNEEDFVKYLEANI